ncbi:MAG: MFS transporter, partial [Micrococcales bacterium]|nr:MFS transporter [Micrococcales bacterium]
LAQTDTQLSVFRLLQGGFAGMSNPQVSGMIQQMFRGRERARAFGFFGGVIGVSTAIGPLLGGVIIALAGPAAGWRWVFFINVPIILVVLPLARRLLPGPPATQALSRLDGFGLLLIGLGTATFMAPFVTTPDSGFFDNPERWILLIPAFALLPVTYFWERNYQRKYHAAVLNPGLLRTPSYVFGAALGAAWFAGFTALMLVMTLMLQNGLAYTALLAGLVQLPNAIASAVTAASSGRLVPRFGRRLVIIGIATYLAGLVVVIVVMRWAPEGAVGWALAGTLLLMGAGGGWVIAPNQTLTYQDVPPRYGSVAGAVLQVGQRVGTAVGMAVVLAVYLSSFSSQVAAVGKAEAARLAGATALIISACFVAVALVVGILDALRRDARKSAA